MAQDEGRNLTWVAAASARYRGRLVDYVARLLGDSDGALDVVQDAFVRLAEQDRANLNGHLAQWLYTVCRRRAIDLRRKDGRMQPLEDEHLARCASRETSCDEALARSEEANRIWAAIETLAPQQQEALRLKFQHELSYREIAGVMEITVSHVGVLLHHGLRKLREHLQSEAEQAEARGA